MLACMHDLHRHVWYDVDLHACSGGDMCAHVLSMLKTGFTEVERRLTNVIQGFVARLHGLAHFAEGFQLWEGRLLR